MELCALDNSNKGKRRKWVKKEAIGRNVTYFPNLWPIYDLAVHEKALFPVHVTCF